MPVSWEPVLHLPVDLCTRQYCFLVYSVLGEGISYALAIPISREPVLHFPVHQQQRNVRPVRPDASGAPGAGVHYFAKSHFMTEPICPGGTILSTSYQAQPPFPQPPRQQPLFPLCSRHTISVSCLSQRVFI